MVKKVTSRPGLFGSTIHCDERGCKIGESRPGFFGDNKPSKRCTLATKLHDSPTTLHDNLTTIHDCCCLSCIVVEET